MIIERRVAPAVKEALDVLIKNFLSMGDVPTKSKLISIMTSLARKHQIQLLTHLSVQNIIDSLVYYVISNDLLDPYKKKELSDNLIRLKQEPVSSEDYMQMIATNEESIGWKQKLIYSQLTKILIVSSVSIIGLGVALSQFKGYMNNYAIYIVNWLLVAFIGFSVLMAAYTLFTVFSHLAESSKKNQPQAQNKEIKALIDSPQTSSARLRLPNKLNLNPPGSLAGTGKTSTPIPNTKFSTSQVNTPQPTEKLFNLESLKTFESNVNEVLESTSLKEESEKVKPEATEKESKPVSSRKANKKDA